MSFSHFYSLLLDTDIYVHLLLRMTWILALLSTILALFCLNTTAVHSIPLGIFDIESSLFQFKSHSIFVCYSFLLFTCGNLEAKIVYFKYTVFLSIEIIWENKFEVNREFDWLGAWKKMCNMSNNRSIPPIVQKWSLRRWWRLVDKFIIHHLFHQNCWWVDWTFCQNLREAINIFAPLSK